ncbi:MAG: greA [Chloroflexi bacterium]|nr:greA [Chloroflexota bacterium]
MTGTAGEDVILEFLICWHLASGEEGRTRVMAALRRRAGRRDRADGGDDGARLWSWCTSVWLPGWMRAAGLLAEARAVEGGDDAALRRARWAAREAAMCRAGGAALVSFVLVRAQACAAVDASGAAAVTCSGVEGHQACLALAAARDAAHAALTDGADIGRVVARLRRAALALVDGMSGEEVDREASAAGTPRSGAVVPGSRVRVRDAEGEHEHTMVTRATADAPPGCVSIDSPVGRALLGCRPGDQVRVQTPGGIRLLTVLEVVAAAVPSPPWSARGCEE